MNEDFTSFKLKDKSQSFDLMIELLFELNTNVSVMKDLLIKGVAKGDEDVENRISELHASSFSSYRHVLIEELSEKFHLEIQ